MITISLCMIVKNEEEVLGRILEQMRPIVDEIIIADTGSTDRTKEIAANYTARIYDFPWIQDFAAARNFVCAKASMDYWMWLDADDLLTPENQQELLKLKETLDPDTDVVMMKYVTGFDEAGRPVFSYYRERLLKNHCGFLWEGNVHEAVTPAGKILYSPIEIEHRKIHPSDPDRNLNIYESMLRNGEILTPRHQFYYGRELYYHQRFDEAAGSFRHFLSERDAWIENRLDAYLLLSHCYEKLKEPRLCMEALYSALLLAPPRAEICCELGRHFLEEQAWHGAIYWYQQALQAPNAEAFGGFSQKDCRDFIPYVQLCVCYDRLGDLTNALKYHQLSRSLKPYSEIVQLNDRYFHQKIHQNSP